MLDQRFVTTVTSPDYFEMEGAADLGPGVHESGFMDQRFNTISRNMFFLTVFSSFLSPYGASLAKNHQSMC